MNNITKQYQNEDGTNETIVMTSNDKYNLKLEGNYRLANHQEKKVGKLSKKFKNSFLGSDIGVRSKGFSTVAILATVIVLTAVAVMYFLWRF